ncbi:GrBNV gp76-like protein-like protein [Mauternbach virus]|uniref:GrBNV gp76-like protein-like protein n=1 Tax=Mauternbach virus TaxID=2486603 RepID=A0A3G3E7I9_9VIRU|nr:GrBNV gp76-like protein-like protein [Mauternbach virus]AYP97905.1 GrBNV gp76-like protein-like protein [Mauternbach virus]
MMGLNAAILVSVLTTRQKSTIYASKVAVYSRSFTLAIMFSVRQMIATNQELARQRAIEKSVLFGKKPTTFIEKKAAAITGHPDINPILQCKISIALDSILKFVDSEKDFENINVKSRISKYLDTINIETGSTLTLVHKLPILSVQPITPIEYVNVLDTEISTVVNIADFEYSMFNGKVKYRYMRETSFATYMYQNIMYFLNTFDVNSLEGIDTWMARYAVLLNHTKFSDYVAKKAFYQDIVSFGGIGYDTSFVPKYDVNNLRPQDPIPCSITDASQIEYYYKLNVFKTDQVPIDKIGIFLTFPFKNGHFIKPNGRIRYLGLDNRRRVLKSTRLMIKNICSVNDIEAALDSAARAIQLDDIIYRAVYSRNLKEQAVALMIIRRIVGNYARIGKYIIQIPNEMAVLSWTKLSCHNNPVILPPIYTDDKKATNYVSMIQDISQMCYNKMGASIICSSHFLPELNLSAIYRLLQTDSEKYIFYTLVLQDYPTVMYHDARDKLKPKFGTSNIDLEKYKRRKRPFINVSMDDSLNLFTRQLVDVSDDDNSNMENKCTPYDCFEMYEFHDEKLKILVADGDVELDRNQLVNFITLSIMRN